MENIKINSEYIKLDQLLKLANVAESGGHAKILIQDGLVKVNGNIEYQRGKKLKVGDCIEVNELKICIV